MAQTTVMTAEEAADKPLIRRKQISAHCDGSLATKVGFSDHSFTFDEPSAHGGTDLGPTPLQGVLGALCGCEAVTFGRTAREMDFAYEGIDFEAEFTIDIRGRNGVRGVVPHFRTVRVEARVTTEGDDAAFRAVTEETEARCPVLNLIKDAGVNLEFRWIKQASA